MATIFSHALVGATLVSFLPPKLQTRRTRFIAGVCAILPDIDYIGFVLRIPYNSLWGHRGMTHSILFAFCIGLILCTFAYREKYCAFILGAFFTLVTLSHGILDALTNGGLGVAFYAPYNVSRYFFPWTPIEVSPMGPRFFSERGLVVLISEFYWICIPCLLMFSLRNLFKRTRTTQ